MVNPLQHGHCVVSAQIRSFLWFLFFRIWTKYGQLLISSYSVWIRENTDQKKLRIWIPFTQCVILNINIAIECKLDAFCTYILFNIISIFWSSGTFVKSDFTSNGTSRWSLGICSFLIFSTKYFVLLMVYSDLLNGDNNLAKYFDKWQVALPMFDTMGLSGNSLIVSFGNSLWIFAVP